MAAQDLDTKLGFAAAALIALGGTIGFVKKGSVMSLVAGGGSGAALAYGVKQNDPRIVVGVSALLFVVMGMRFARGRKIMPAGLVTFLTAVLLYRFGQRLL
ncbi:hypothetical protein JCM10207_003127 [Rhodosporidiobolus poonsookiae]